MRKISYVIDEDIIVVKGFRHMPGKNCQLSSLRKILAHRGLEISENMLLGIASGLGFMYWNMKGLDFPFIGGLNGKNITIFENAMRRLGGEARLVKTSSLKRSYSALKEMLKDGPAISFVDMASLPFFFRDDAPYPNEEAGHFGGHTFVVYGIDEVKDIVYISDRYAKPMAMRISHFMDAHSSKHKPFPAANRKLEFTFPDNLPDLEQAIVETIRENAKVMTEPPISNFGLKGMMKYSKMVEKWPEEYASENLLMGLITTWIYSQTGGTGGAMFRNMYSGFLEEAHEVTGATKLGEAAEIYRQAAAAWDEVALLLLPDEEPAMTVIRKAFWEINEVQEKAEPDYQARMREIDDRWKFYKAEAIEEAGGYRKYVPRLQEAIQKVYDLEEKAWEILVNV